MEEDTYTVERLLKVGTNPSCVDKNNGKSALHYAAELGNFTYVDLLVDKNARFDMVDKENRTILHSAAIGNLTDLTDMLIKYGVDVHAMDTTRRQAMHYSVSVTSSPYGTGMAVLSLLLSSSVDARLLWALGAYGRDGNNFTAINIKEIKVLLTDGANPNAVDTFENKRALHFAVLKGVPVVVEMLLDSGAMVNHVDIFNRTALHYAARLDNPGSDENVGVLIATLLLRSGADVNAQDHNNMAALHFSASLGAKSMLDIFLLNKDANVHALGGKMRRTALHFAAHSENISGGKTCCEFLLKKGSNVFGVDVNRRTALDLAIDRNAIDTVNLLLGSNLNSQLLWGVGGFGRKNFSGVDHSEILTLLKKGANPDSTDPLDGRGALHIGSATRDIELVNILLDNEADVNIRDFNKSAPLHFAVDNRDSEMTLLLLARRANIHNVDKDDRTVLHISLEQGDVEMASTLLTMGADVNAVDNEGRTALHDTVLKNETQMVETLLKQGADVHAIDARKKNPLHYAVENNFIEIIPLLLAQSRDAQLLWSVGGYERPKPFEVHRHEVIPILREHTFGGEKLEGANVNAVDPLTGCTALHYAASIGATEIVKLMLSKKRVVGETAEVNALDNVGMTPLHWAARSGDTSLEVARILADMDCDVHASDQDGNGPLFYAVESKAVAMVGLLLDKGADESSIIFEKLLECSMTVRLLWTLGGYGNNVTEHDASKVEQLLKNGANILRIDSTSGRVALHYAVLTEKTNVVEMIVKKDQRSIECQDLDENMPLDLAFHNGNSGNSRVLVENGALNFHKFMNLDQVDSWRKHFNDDIFFVEAIGRQILARTTGISQDDVSELYTLLSAVLDSGLCTELPSLVRSKIIAPIVTNKDMVSYLKRKERMRCIEESCVIQLKILQEKQENIFKEEKLAKIVGKLGKELKLGQDIEKGGKAIVSRQDAILPKTTGTGLNEIGYIHMLCMLALALDDSFNEELIHVVDGAVGYKPDLVVATNRSTCMPGEVNIQEASPKTFERMSLLLESAHEMKKRPRPAHNLDVLRASATFGDLGALERAYYAISRAFDIVRIKNMYAGKRKGQHAGEWDSVVEESFGFRSIVLNVVFKPPNLTFGQLYKEHGKRGGAWFEYVLKRASADAQMALSFMGNANWKNTVVKLICEVQLIYRPFLEHGKIRSHIYKKFLSVSNSRDLSLTFDPNASERANLGGRTATPAAKQKKGVRVRAFVCTVCGRNNPGDGQEAPEDSGNAHPDDDLPSALEIQQELNDWIVELQTNGCTMKEYVENTALLKKKLVRARRRDIFKAPGVCRVCGTDKGRNLQAGKLGQEIYDATCAGQTSTVKVLCEHSTREEVNWSNGIYRTTALMAAAAAGHVDIVSTLCNSGAEQELRENGVYTAKDIGELYAPMHRKPLDFKVNTRENAKRETD